MSASDAGRMILTEMQQMGGDFELGQYWKWVALATLVVCVLLATILAYTLRLHSHPAHQTDNRLIGTWQSDAERTVAEWRERRPITDDQADSLRREIFGLLRVTYTTRDQIEEFKGRITTSSYTVVGRDDASVVIQASNPEFGADKLTQIHFVDTDSFWVHVELSPLREYFRRVKPPGE